LSTYLKTPPKYTDLVCFM